MPRTLGRSAGQEVGYSLSDLPHILLVIQAYFSGPPYPFVLSNPSRSTPFTVLNQFFSQLARADAGSYQSGWLLPQQTAVSNLPLRTDLRLFRVYERFMPRLES
jgi:hypothetical protein